MFIFNPHLSLCSFLRIFFNFIKIAYNFKNLHFLVIREAVKELYTSLRGEGVDCRVS